jgi:hypothetical protein
MQNHIFASIILVPFFIGIIRLKRLKKETLYVFWFVAFGVANEFTGFLSIWFEMAHKTMPKRHLYTFVSFLLLGLFYNSMLRGFFRKNWILRIVVLFEVYFLINSFFIRGIYEYPGLARSISIFILVLFSIVYFYKTMVEAKLKSLSKEPLVWFNTAILIYYSGSLFFNILFDLIFDYSKEFGNLTFFYFRILNVLFYSLLAIGFWKIKPLKRNKKRRELSSNLR